MIVYRNDVSGFRQETESNVIAHTIEGCLKEKLGRGTSPSEKASWQNSFQFVNNAIRNSRIPDDCGVLIEFTLPLSSKRIDLMITGRDHRNDENAVIVELKQWSEATKTVFPDLVRTLIGQGFREVAHPSYQAASYKSFLTNFIEAFYEADIVAHACAYLHNYRKTEKDDLLDVSYQFWIDQAPIFFNQDYEIFSSYLREKLTNGDGILTLDKIESSKIRPSKKLIESVDKLFEGNEEFILLDDQKVAFEKAKRIAEYAETKNVVLIHGGPGTGKSVISMNLLRDLLKVGQNTVFVAPSGPFREVVQAQLGAARGAAAINHLFKGGASFLECATDRFDSIVVDEAHRLSGPHQWYRGVSQVADIVRAARTSVFFVDDNQALRLKDIGNSAEIRRCAELENATLTEIQLSTQFRCSGADGYVNWLDHTWHIQETGNFDGWARKDFEFIICDSPNELREKINSKQDEGFSARLLAGYAWPWTKESDGNPNGEISDVSIPEYGFSMPWNARANSRLWAVEKSGNDQVGCIYTSQGLEFDYVGVIVGNDIGFDRESMSWVPSWSDYKDHGGRSGLSNRPDDLRKYICNIYKVLMTRGMKGCFVYFRNESAKNYFTERFQHSNKL